MLEWAIDVAVVVVQQEAVVVVECLLGVAGMFRFAITVPTSPIGRTTTTKTRTILILACHFGFF